ncbi:hypothetical protein B296_00029823 [Ensete ventricosum]|uniref:Uncharacterized protein n=1 Tax=Ensete ventricosum TaxID=4639 RepID=A0A426XWA0_ENSVE|nr:hypothetical protein B296_00029823 [Ensete ventricosum]
MKQLLQHPCQQRCKGGSNSIRRCSDVFHAREEMMICFMEFRGCGSWALLEGSHGEFFCTGNVQTKECLSKGSVSDRSQRQRRLQRMQPLCWQSIDAAIGKGPSHRRNSGEERGEIDRLRNNEDALVQLEKSVQLTRDPHRSPTLHVVLATASATPPHPLPVTLGPT